MDAKQINGCCGHYRFYTDWYKIKFCKIFEDPTALEDPFNWGGKEFYDTAYRVVVHFSVPEGYWRTYRI